MVRRAGNLDPHGRCRNYFFARWDSRKVAEDVDSTICSRLKASLYDALKSKRNCPQKSPLALGRWDYVQPTS
jgi:hypothetical protein